MRNLHSSSANLSVIMILCALLLVVSCRQSENTGEDAVGDSRSLKEQQKKSCDSCHSLMPDSDHAFACVVCHDGSDPAASVSSAHRTLLREPAHPENMAAKCGGCHELVADAAVSQHFLLPDEINRIRQAFGASSVIRHPEDIPVNERPETIVELVDDMLRRRCLRCHVYYVGEPYNAVFRGTGCAACHLEYKDGELVSHEFVRVPPDRLCLQCHYGNFVGADYYGRFENDFNWEYRVPFQPDGTTLRPYGVEYQRLQPDIHQRAGMICVDCHSGAELMGISSGSGLERVKIRCLDCHDRRGESTTLAGRMMREEDGFFLQTKRNYRLRVPQMSNPAHARYGDRVNCLVCHARWSFDDMGTHLIRLDVMDYEPWGDLTVQGSFEVEQQLEEELFGTGGFDEPFMSDKFTGENKKGIWIKGFELRRWEKLPTCQDENGIYYICRPILDLHVSYVDEEGRVVFDSVGASNSRKLSPYIPHTTGKAGEFYKLRLPPNIRMTP